MTKLVWILEHAHGRNALGFIPAMLDDNDPRPAREQLDANYQHGGGWRKFNGFEMLPDYSIKYPEDPPLPVLAEAVLHTNTDKPETIRLYTHGWVAIVQKDGSYEIARMD
jgi:hypothetical protein